MMDIRMGIIVTASTLMVILTPMPVGAEELEAGDRFRIEFGGLLHLETALRDFRSTVLVPAPAARGYETRQDSAILVTTGKVSMDELTLSAQFRAVGRDTGESVGPYAKGAKAYLDELYWELSLWKRKAFIYAGRRNIAFGQSYGINPADVFFDDSRRDRRLPIDRQRSETRGMDLAGAQFVLDQGGSLEAFYAPATAGLNKGEKDRWLVAYRDMLDWHAIDFTLLGFGGRRPGGALSLNGTLVGDTIFYADMALRKGRPRAVVSAVAPDGSFALDPGRKRPDFAATIGLGHAFGNGLSVNVEYTHATGGYDDDQWRRLLTALDANTPVTSAEAAARLPVLGSLVSGAYLRRNYVLVRMAHDSLLDTSLKGEFVVLHGLDDSSGQVSLRLEYPIGDQLTLGVAGFRRYGSRTSEFGMRTEKGMLALQMMVDF